MDVSPQKLQTPYGIWQRKLITDAECMPVAHDLKNFVDDAEKNNTFADKSKTEKAEIIHGMLERSHRRLMQTKAFRDLSEEEENQNYDFLEKWVLGKVHGYTFGKSREVRQRDRRMFKHVRCLQFLNLKDLDFPEDSPLLSQPHSPDVLLEDAAAAFARIETVHNCVNKLICIDSGCRVIMDVIQKVSRLQYEARKGSAAPQVFGADDFMPLLIYTIIRSNPGSLWSNIEYIETYRTAWRKVGQQNYHFTAFSSAAKFIQDLTAENLASLHISQEEFREKYARLEEAYYDETSSKDSAQAQPPEQVNIHLQVERGFLDDVKLKFLACESIAEVRVGDLEAMLEEYKKMGAIIAELKAATDDTALQPNANATPNGKHVQFASPRSNE
eukprot:g2564.t1